MRWKKWWSFFLLSFCSVVIVFLVSYRNIQSIKKRQEERELVQKIQDSFHEDVRTSARKKIYQKENGQYYEVGFVEKGIYLSLEEAKVHTTKDIYFKIKDFEYYIDYQYLEKVSHIEDTSLQRFISKKQITTEKTELYQEDKIVFSVSDSMTFDVLLELEGKYFVSFLGQIYFIYEPLSVVEKEVQSTMLLERLSVFYLDSSISREKVEEIFSLFQEKGYSSLTMKEFSYWIQGMGHLPSSSILILGTDDQKKNFETLTNSYDFSIETELDPYSFQEGDQQLKVGDRNYYMYLVSNSIIKERISEMLAGIPKKVEGPSASSVAVLNYHFFYDSKTEACNESICLSTDNFRKQLSYLKENGYKTLTMQEFYDWKSGKITVPKKSVLLTIDDGAMGTDTHLPQILEEYQMHASLFLITGWWDVSKYQKTSYLEIYSHGNELHHNNYCAGGKCGYKPLLLSKDEIVSDLKESLSKGISKLAFCYPFYQTSKTLESALKEVGISLAFAGGNKKASRNGSNYYIPRYIIYKGTSMSQFIRMVS